MKFKGSSVGSMTLFGVCGYLLRMGTNEGIQFPAMLLSFLVSLVALVIQVGPQLLQESKPVTHLVIHGEYHVRRVQ